MHLLLSNNPCYVRRVSRKHKTSSPPLWPYPLQGIARLPHALPPRIRSLRMFLPAPCVCPSSEHPFCASWCRFFPSYGFSLIFARNSYGFLPLCYSLASGLPNQNLGPPALVGPSSWQQFAWPPNCHPPAVPYV